MKRDSMWGGGLIAVTLLLPIMAASGQQVPHSAAVTRIAHEIDQIDAALASTPVRTKGFTKGSQSGIVDMCSGAAGVSKLVVQMVSEAGGVVVEYYYKNGSLIYAIEARKSFGSSPPAVGETPGLTTRTALSNSTAISEDRFYLEDGTLIGWLSGKGCGPVSLAPATTDENKLAAKGEEIRQAAARWKAFAESSASDFNRFQIEQS